MRIELTPPSRADLDGWCLREFGAASSRVLFQAGHLSSVTGVRLADGREVVVKVRAAAGRLESCFRIQRHLWRSGFPCPEPLAPPLPLGALTATAEAYLPGGGQLQPAPDLPAFFACALRGLVAAASSFNEPFDLSPAPPWVGWGHPGAATWPEADDRDDDLNALAEPVWLEDMGRRVRARLLKDKNPAVIGHGDWWQPNLFWDQGRLHCVHDWDSLVYLSEAAIAGAASTGFSVLDWGSTTVEESAAFLDEYEAAMGRHWTADEREIAWAAGLWQLAFNARKDVYEGVLSNLEHLELFGEDRLRRAGC